jgi:hypothetical protein
LFLLWFRLSGISVPSFDVQLVVVNETSGATLRTIGAPVKLTTPIDAEGGAGAAFWAGRYYLLMRDADDLTLIAWDIKTGALALRQRVHTSTPVIAIGGMIFDDGNNTVVTALRFANGDCVATCITPATGDSSPLFAYPHGVSPVSAAAALVTYERVFAQVVLTASGVPMLYGVNVETASVQWLYQMAVVPLGLTYALFK